MPRIFAYHISRIFQVSRHCWRQIQQEFLHHHLQSHFPRSSQDLRALSRHSNATPERAICHSRLAGFLRDWWSVSARKLAATSRADYCHEPISRSREGRKSIMFELSAWLATDASYRNNFAVRRSDPDLLSTLTKPLKETIFIQLVIAMLDKTGPSDSEAYLCPHHTIRVRYIP